MKPRAWLGHASWAVALFLLSAALNNPLFLPGELPYRDSIEGGYASMARFVAANPNPWGWNPMQYCGLPSQFTYLPLLPYSTAALLWLFPGLDAPYAYRLLTVVLACLGPVTLYFFCLYFTRSRFWSVAVAAAYIFFSPTYGFILQQSNDRGVAYLPWRMQVLVKYGEGPHTVGMTILPLSLIALWAASTGKRFWQMFLAAGLLALVALTNWVASLGMALCCVLLFAAGAGTGKKTNFQPRRFLATAGLAYLLACFWLTPSFIRVTAFNWPTDSFGYRAGMDQFLLLGGLLGGLVLIRVLFLRFPRESYLCFVSLGCYAFAWIVLAHYWYAKDTIPESRRYSLEFIFFLFVLSAEGFRRLLRRPDFASKMCGLLIVFLLLREGWRQPWLYATQSPLHLAPVRKERTVEYRVAQWLDRHRPSGRVFASGGLRFRMNGWFDLPQVGGTFESGLANRAPVQLAYQIRAGREHEPGREGIDAVARLKALGAEYVVVHGPDSKEHYRDFRNSGKFEGLLEAVYREENDWIYRAPFASFAHLVRPSELPPEPPVDGSIRSLLKYAAALDDASRPRLRAKWQGPNRIEIEGPLPPEMLVSLQVSHDSGWQATQDGRELPVEKDSLGYLLLRPRAADRSRIELEYRGSMEQRVMAGISLAAWGAAAMLARRRRKGGIIRAWETLTACKV
ncbi:MAG: hypothetical protein WD696_08065 [Bryobacteraceae bacterium]